MNKSRLGQLIYKFEHSGVNKEPVISNKELLELVVLIEETKKIAEDYGDKPLLTILNYDLDAVKRMQYNRSWRKENP